MLSVCDRLLLFIVDAMRNGAFLLDLLQGKLFGLLETFEVLVAKRNAETTGQPDLLIVGRHGLDPSGGLSHRDRANLAAAQHNDLPIQAIGQGTDRRAPEAGIRSCGVP